MRLLALYALLLISTCSFAFESGDAQQSSSSSTYTSTVNSTARNKTTAIIVEGGTKNADREPVTNTTPAQVATAQKLGVDPRWVKPDGSPDWPTKANNGFDGGFAEQPIVIELKPGQTFDRYGGRFDEHGNFTDQGSFVSPKDVTFDQRSLPDSCWTLPYRQYEVVKPIAQVNAGTAAPWFGKPGGGIQYQLPMNIDKLMKEGFIKPTNKPG